MYVKDGNIRELTLQLDRLGFESQLLLLLSILYGLHKFFKDQFPHLLSGKKE